MGIALKMRYQSVKYRWMRPLSRLGKSFRKVQKDSPIVIELFIAVCILCILLIADVLWLGAAHRREMKAIKESHLRDVDKFRKQVDVQIHQVDAEHQRKAKDKMEEHNKDVDQIKVRHQQELERKINGIQQDLNSLMALSKTYWEEHAVNHDKDLQHQDI